MTLKLTNASSENWKIIDVLNICTVVLVDDFFRNFKFDLRLINTF